MQGSHASRPIEVAVELVRIDITGRLGGVAQPVAVSVARDPVSAGKSRCGRAELDPSHGSVDARQGVRPSSISHSSEQQSPGRTLPSSHVSPRFTKPSPHNCASHSGAVPRVRTAASRSDGNRTDDIWKTPNVQRRLGGRARPRAALASMQRRSQAIVRPCQTPLVAHVHPSVVSTISRSPALDPHRRGHLLTLRAVARRLLSAHENLTACDRIWKENWRCDPVSQAFLLAIVPPRRRRPPSGRRLPKGEVRMGGGKNWAAARRMPSRATTIKWSFETNAR